MNCLAALVLSSLSMLIPTLTLAQVPGQPLSTAFTVGDVHVVAVDPANPSIVYAGTNGRGIFKSINEGGSWKNVDSGIPPRSHIDEIVIDPSNPTTVRIFETTDGGEMWTPLSPQLTHDRISTVAVDPTHPEIIYAGTSDNGIFKSIDKGKRWIRINSGLPEKEIVAISIVPAEPKVLYMLTNQRGIYKSIDGGRHWSAANRGLTQKDAGRTPQERWVKERMPITAFVIDPSDPETLYAGATMHTTSGDSATIFKSTNAGASWRMQRVIGTPLGFTYVHCLVVAPSSAATIYAGVDSEGVLKSFDKGENWSLEDFSLTAASIVALAIGPTDGTLYAGTLDGVFVLEDHKWRQIGFRVKDFGGEWIAFLATLSRTVLCFLCFVVPVFLAFAAGALSYRPTIAHAVALMGPIGTPWMYWTTLQDMQLSNPWIAFNVPEQEIARNRDYSGIAALTILSFALIVLAIGIAGLRLLPERWKFRGQTWLLSF